MQSLPLNGRGMTRRGYRPAPNRHTVKLRAELAGRNADLAVAAHLRRESQRVEIAALNQPAWPPTTTAQKPKRQRPV